MKSSRKWIVIIAMVLCTAFVLSACTTQKPAAKIGDSRQVTVQSLENAYKNYASYAGYYGYDVSTDQGRKDYLEYLLNSLVDRQLLVYEAEKKGYALTDEEKAEAKKSGAEQYEEYYQQFVEYPNSNEVYSAKQVSDRSPCGCRADC